MILSGFLFFCKSAWNFACRFQLNRKASSCIIFAGLLYSSFSRYYVCKQPSVFQAASFGDLLLNEKQKKPFVWLKHEVTITQWFRTAAPLAQVDKRWTKLIRICFVVTLVGSIRVRWSFFFLFFCLHHINWDTKCIECLAAKCLYLLRTNNLFLHCTFNPLMASFDPVETRGLLFLVNSST